jgi:hypothetical protein
MRLDIRVPVGMLFGLIGIILTVFGLAGDRAIYRQSLGINVNLYWGIALLCFGLLMLLLGIRAMRRPKHTAGNTHG